ncbi:leucine-rich repeat-containing protein 14 isoform X2 [Lutra lutra]|uniref:leucine-rich repeat-containing protein 14 isoform X2 n=2 Tax=Lutra lutra TaxID=9657 RepID=UPI001FD3796F|nr:leucine-rich repeat-containing protein 14 isoform X2 [Lutra lutra]
MAPAGRPRAPRISRLEGDAGRRPMGAPGRVGGGAAPQPPPGQPIRGPWWGGQWVAITSSRRAEALGGAPRTARRGGWRWQRQRPWGRCWSLGPVTARYESSSRRLSPGSARPGVGVPGASRTSALRTRVVHEVGKRGASGARLLPLPRAHRPGCDLGLARCRAWFSNLFPGVGPGSGFEDEVLGAQWLPAWPSAMHTLVFLSTRQVLQCQPAACQALPLLPRELFPLLFKVAFMDKKTVVLRELVHTWPFPLLSFQQLLQECAHCSRALLQERPSTESMQAVILGLTARLHTPETEAGTQPLCRKHALRVLDMTGLLDDGVEQDPGTMSMWDCTAAVARTCIAQQQGGTVEPGQAPLPVEVRVDLRVNRASYAFLREALRSSVGSPLRLCCRDLRAEDLPMRNTVALLQLLDAGCLRRVDLRFNNLGLRGLSVIIPHVARFQHLASLRLHYVHGDSRQPSVDGEDNFRYFLAQMGRFTCLRELSMGSSLLSGRLDQLLSTLQSPLESLELAFCALLPEDLRFLAQSPHAVHLKKLDLSGNDLSGNQLEPFQGLLQAAAATLLHLELTECQLADTQLLSTLPVLTRCASLRYLGLYGNPLSMAGLKELLRDSVVQAELRTVVHPFPVDCYEGLPWPPPASVLLEASINEEKFARVEAELHQLLLASGRAHVLWTTDIYGRLAADYFSL